MPSCVLMERAWALRFVEELEKRNLCCGSVGIVCGTGNNGGDGLASRPASFSEGLRRALLSVETPPMYRRLRDAI